jgi:hypothetical protein
MDSSTARYDDLIVLNGNILLIRVSLTVNVRQAIRAEDSKLLWSLARTVDVKTICATAKELSGEEATKLLEHFAGYLTEDPRRLSVVIEWTRELLFAHAGYISSQTRTKMTLKPILDIINQRLSDNCELVHMRQVMNTVIRHSQKSAVDVTTPTRSSESDEPAIRWSAA